MIVYRVDPRRRLVEATASGHIGVADIEAYVGALAADPAVGTDFDTVIDLSADHTLPQPEELRHIALRVARAGGDARPRRALVAPGDASYGLLRMFRAFVSAFRGADASPQYEVFRSRADAYAWLAGGPARRRL